MKKIFGLFRLIRFELPFSAGVCVVMGQLLALNEFTSVSGILLGFFSVFFISASILVSNDYFDVETDRINSPDRPIPSNLVTQSEALLFSIFLFLLGLTLSYLINLTTFIFSIILIAIGLLYNRKFKKYGIFGNLLVSFSVGMTFIYGGLSVGIPYEIAVIFFGVIAALIDLGEEIAADAMDIQGDLLIDSNSIAIKYGRTTALTISSMIFSFVIILTIVPFVLNWFTLEYIIPIAIMDFAIGYSTIKLLRSQNEEGRKYIRWIYLGATAGLIVFIIFRVIGL
ncbi:MAG: UbiA family prenyltransferase [Melioribacteraceae bacterium]|nr:UbiA family prenyltransferase [Melioribacteraceae bacterium]